MSVSEPSINVNSISKSEAKLNMNRLRATGHQCRYQHGSSKIAVERMKVLAKASPTMTHYVAVVRLSGCSYFCSDFSLKEIISSNCFGHTSVRGHISW